MIKAVIFDVDGTLIDSFEANFRFFRDLMTQSGYAAPAREDYASIFHRPMMDIIKLFSKSSSKEEIERIYKIGMGRDIGYDLSLLKMPDQAEATLEKLSQDYMIGIVTGRVRQSVFEAPDLEKLKKYFKVAVAYQDTENHKPHPEPLLLAARKLGIKPEECVYVGDVENDMIAAKAAHMKAILYSLYSKAVSPSADASTSVFHDLPKIVRLLQ